MSAPRIDEWALMNPNLSIDATKKMYAMTLVDIVTLADRIARAVATNDPDSPDASHDEQQVLVALHKALTGLVVPCVAAAVDPFVNPYTRPD